MLPNDHLFSNIGIDSIGFHAPRSYITLDDLAESRHVDPNKFRKGLLIKEMRFPDIGEDIVSMGMKAGYNALSRGNISPKEIDAVFVGTETITYAVKSVSNIFAQLLKIRPNCFTQDIYNACSGGTLAILNSIGLIKSQIIDKALIICTDVSTYSKGSPSEATQGAGAAAFVISRNPRIARFSKKFGKISGNVNDFLRLPNDENAQVFGKYSLESYLNFQLEAYDDLVEQLGDFHADFYTFHAPFAKLPIKCMQQIILKRWARHIRYLPKIRKNKDGTSLLQKLDNFLHDFTVLPEYIYLKLKERGHRSETLEQLSHWFISHFKNKVLPQLRIPSHFGNMYNASIYAQLIYLFENLAYDKATLYFGSYGSGATCISGLLKIDPRYREIITQGPTIMDYLNNKKKMDVKEYENIKYGHLKPLIHIAKIKPHEYNNDRGFLYHFCDKGCLIPDIRGLDYCPKGHSGFHERFFPLFATLESKPKMTNAKDFSFLKQDMVCVNPHSTPGNALEYDLRRIKANSHEITDVSGLFNWVPTYIPAYNIY